MKIAVVDDNESERTKLCTLLREWGEKRKYEMVCNEFTDGEDFLKVSGNVSGGISGHLYGEAEWN